MLSLQRHAPLIRRCPQPIPPFPKAMKSVKPTFIKPTVQDFCKASAHHTASGLVNLQQTTQKKKLPYSQTRNNSTNEPILCCFQHSAPDLAIY
jgi:hypothetical protein